MPSKGHRTSTPAHLQQQAPADPPASAKATIRVPTSRPVVPRLRLSSVAGPSVLAGKPRSGKAGVGGRGAGAVSSNPSVGPYGRTAGVAPQLTYSMDDIMTVCGDLVGNGGDTPIASHPIAANQVRPVGRLSAAMRLISFPRC